MMHCNMKKKTLLLFLLSPLIFLAVFAIYIFVSGVMDNNKTYYFPQIETYIKLYKPPFNKYGYILLSKDSAFSFSKNIDYVRIYRAETTGISFIVDPLENYNLYIVDRWNDAQINQVQFGIEKINRDDINFFDKGSISGVNTYILKSHFFEFFVEGYLNTVWFLDYDIDENLIKAEPIN